MHTLRTSSAHAQFYRCAHHRKAATHNWHIQVSGAQGKHKLLGCYNKKIGEILNLD
jgi:hypothetical protein